jgi:putative transport protein
MDFLIDILYNIFTMSGNITVVMVGMFVIAFLGYILGRINIKGVFLGTAGVFLIALLFGYLFTLDGLQNIPFLNHFFISDATSEVVGYYKMIETFGLIFFVTSVGFMAGPNFFHDFKRNAKSYILLGVVIVLIGSVLAWIFALIPGIGSAYSTGILSGALTSTPAFAAAKAGVAAGSEGLVALGHAVAYPFGVVGVVLFVQLVPKILKINKEEERIKMQESFAGDHFKPNPWKGRIVIDDLGLAPMGMAIVLGILLGSVCIPLSTAGYGGTTFSLGNTGGPLIMALIFGHFGHIGRVNLAVPKSTLVVFRELGLMLFLIGAGIEGGVELVEQIAASDLGVMLLLYGFIAGILMTMLPALAGMLIAKYILKMPLFNYLGSITGGMTSTPALGALIKVAESDDVASAYASTYPIALILVVITSQLIVLLI